MAEFFESITSVPGAMLIIGLAGLAILISIAWYCVNLVRGFAYGEDTETTLPTDFNQIKAWVTDEEYQRIRESTPVPELPTKDRESTSIKSMSKTESALLGQNDAHSKPADNGQEDVPVFRETSE